MVTILDVSNYAGVSTATVSRVINKPELVDAKTRDLVTDAIAHLGYRPNQVARGLASRSSRTIGVVINNFSATYYGRMLDGVDRALRPLGYKTIAESSREASEGEREAWLSLLDRQCEAVVIHSDSLEDEELTLLLERYPTCVLMNRFLASHPERSIYLDNVRGGALAARFLVKNGHRDMAMICGPDRFYEANDRARGFKEELARAGLTLAPELTVQGNFREQGGLEAMDTLLETRKPFTALFCHSDEMAAGALEACRRRDIGVPEQISIIGFDDLDVARHMTPKLTTIRQPLGDIGEAAGLAAHALATKTESADLIQRVFVAELVDRASVARLRSNDTSTSQPD